MLELSIQENTAVMRLLIQALTGIATLPATTAAPVEIDKPEATKTVGKAEPATPEVDAVEKAEPVTYEDVKKLIIDLSKKDKALAVGALGHFGAAKGPELKPAQFAEFIVHAKELLCV